MESNGVETTALKAAASKVKESNEATSKIALTKASVRIYVPPKRQRGVQGSNGLTAINDGLIRIRKTEIKFELLYWNEARLGIVPTVKMGKRFGKLAINLIP